MISLRPITSRLESVSPTLAPSASALGCGIHRKSRGAEAKRPGRRYRVRPRTRGVASRAPAARRERAHGDSATRVGDATARRSRGANRSRANTATGTTRRSVRGCGSGATAAPVTLVSCVGRRSATSNVSMFATPPCFADVDELRRRHPRGVVSIGGVAQVENVEATRSPPSKSASRQRRFVVHRDDGVAARPGRMRGR